MTQDSTKSKASSILHGTHVELSSGLAGLGGALYDIDPDSRATYRDSYRCPTVHVDLSSIFGEVKKLLGTYLVTLLAPSDETLWQHFKHEFKS